MPRNGTRTKRLMMLGVAIITALPDAGAEDTAVDLQTSRVYVFVGKRGLGHEHAVEGSLAAGTLRLGAAEQAGRLVFDMRSFRADTAAARRLLELPGETDPDTHRQVTDNMLGPDVLDVARHPQAIFDVASANPAPPVVPEAER
jgi:polyisoprenoid-binding protein YceI